VPTIGGFSNPGAVLPALKSTQLEVGLRGGDAALGWQVAAFRIKRPVTNIGQCSGCEAAFDGDALHRGVEASANWAQGPWQLWGGLTVLDAKRRNSTAAPAVNGFSPVNVPDLLLRSSASYRVAAVPGLSLQGHVSHEGRRAVTADNTIELPSWTRLDAALRYEQRIGATQTSWTLGIDNVLDRRYWKESPTQFGHIYLYPGAPRTVRLAFTAAL
jgi:iron complex outermembrane receptor protein